MKIRKIIVALLLAVSALTLLSCSWFINLGQGQLSFTFSDVVPRGDYDYYGRVYLLSDGNRYALSGSTEYLQVPLSEFDPTTVVVEGIPVGPEYTALIGVVQQLPEGWFSTEGWGESIDPFQVIPSEIISVPISFQSSPQFYPVEPLMGKNIKDVESEGTQIYAADAKNIHVGDLNYLWDPTPWPSYPVTDGHTINSLTMGIDMNSVPSDSSQLWANTDRGILPSNGEGFNAPLTEKLGTVSILDSGVGVDSAWTDRVLYFRRAEGIGGTFILQNEAADPSLWSWVNLGTDRTLDMTLGTKGGAAFVTIGGAFRVPEGLLQDSTPSLAEYRSNISAPSPLRSLHIFDNDAEEELHAGTEDGAWQNPAFDFPDLGLIREAGTEGYPIRRIAFETSYFWRAYLSDAYIFVFDDIGTLVGKYPFVSGFPGKVNAIKWVYDAAGGSKYLFIATDQGLVYTIF